MKLIRRMVFVGCLMLQSWDLLRSQQAMGQTGITAAAVKSELQQMAEDIRETVTIDLPPNVPLPTAGGTQVWTDHRLCQGYRLQRNSLTGHWRVLDTKDIRRAWGTRLGCEKAIDRLCPDRQVPAPSHTVVLLHGLMRTHHCMKPLGNTIRQSWTAPDEDGPSVETICFAYASTRWSISQHAAALRDVLESQPKSTRFSFVGHSMGNIVVRHLIADLQRDGDPSEILNRCDAMVMLGPPNNGASIARRLAPTRVYGWVTGNGGLELGPRWESFSKKLATPPFPFLVIAGDVSDRALQNPLVDGSSDWVVSVDEARLDGAVAVETFPVLHSFLMKDEAVVRRTIQFLDEHSQARDQR